LKVCSKCGIEQDIDRFSVTKRNEDGSVRYRHSWCNLCRTIQNRDKLGYKEGKRAAVDYAEELKECNHCHVMLPFADFSPSARGSAGLAAYCKPCQVERYYDKEKGKLSTQAYRDRNRAWWRALHRIHQFNRRNLIKATEDGTVTNDFVVSVYAKEICYWCGEFTKETDRTLEHIIELSSGGLHSASNITMACLSCNSSRLNKGVKEVERN